MKTITWETNKVRPADNDEIVILNHGGKRAMAGAYHAYFEEVQSEEDDMLDTLWEDVVLWTPYPTP